MYSESAMPSKQILVPVMPAKALDPVSAVHRLLNAFLGGRKAETITAYRQDLEDFQAFIQAPSLEQAASLLLTRGQGEANALALDYKAHLMDRKLAANTINRRLTALRSLVKLGRTLGLISWTIEVQSVKAGGAPHRFFSSAAMSLWQQMNLGIVSGGRRKWVNR